jgi:hypothetical protein
MKSQTKIVCTVVILLLLLAILLVIFLNKSHEKMEVNAGAGETKLWILNKSISYKDLRVTVKGDKDVILYSSSIAPDKMSPPITIPDNTSGRTVIHTSIYISGSTYTKNFTAIKGQYYSMVIDKDYMNPSGGPKIVIS